MAYLLEVVQSDNKVVQEIADKDTLDILLGAYLDGELPVECRITTVPKKTFDADDEWYGKGESGHDG